MADKSLIVKEAQRYLARGQVDKAIAEWEKLVREAADGNVYNTIGDLHLKKGNKKPAVEFFHKAAAFFRGGGFSLKALALYKKVINIDPADAGAYTALGELRKRVSSPMRSNIISPLPIFLRRKQAKKGSSASMNGYLRWPLQTSP